MQNHSFLQHVNPPGLGATDKDLYCFSGSCTKFTDSCSARQILLEIFWYGNRHFWPLIVSSNAVTILPLLYHSARTSCWVLSIGLHHVSHEGLYHFHVVQKRCAAVHIPNLHSVLLPPVQRYHRYSGTAVIVR